MAVTTTSYGLGVAYGPAEDQAVDSCSFAPTALAREQ